jgi:hypothetical protein
MEEILEMVRDRLAASPFASQPRGRVIATGGASELTGFADLAARVLGRPVRIGRPLGIGGGHQQGQLGWADLGLVTEILNDVLFGQLAGLAFDFLQLLSHCVQLSGYFCFGCHDLI